MSTMNPVAIHKVLNNNCQVKDGDRLLVAVSGGADSMALLNILNQDWDVTAAHCNFQLRGEESDSDEQLVKDFCSKNHINLHVKSFDTKAYAGKKSISIEMAAREIRYDWFSELISEFGFDSVVTGHHGNDSIETFFLNLVRGTGVKGLSGIQYRNGNVVRPLLGYTRIAIEDYCAQHDIDFCHDASNDDTKFIRNKIRHNIIPVLESINPSLFDTMQANMAHLKDAELLIEKEVSRFRKDVLVDEHDKVIIPVSKLHDYTNYRTILFEVLQPYGFNSAVVNDVVKNLHGTSGKQFFSKTHRLIKDRHNLLVMPLQEIGVDHFWLEEGESVQEVPMKVRIYDKPNDFKFSRSSNLIHLDAGLVDLPLMVRKWQNGDVFMPLGMSGYKKVSDFFIDEKFSLADKEDSWLMLSGEDIVWIVGHRIDERYKVTGRTKEILEIGLK